MKFLCVVSALLFVSNSSLAKDKCVQGGLETNVGVRVKIEQSMPMNTSLLVMDAEPGSRYIRAEIAVMAATPDPWFLVVRDSSFHPIQTFTEADFTAGSRWTVRVPGAQINLDLSAGLRPPEIKSPTHMYMPANAGTPYYSIKGDRPDYTPLYSVPSPALRRLGDHAVLILGSAGTSVWACSGVAVAKDLVLTNWHCGAPLGTASDSAYWTDAVAHETFMDASWDDDALSADYDVAAVEAADKDLDFALLRVSPTLASRAGIRPAVIKATGPASGQVYAVHHPAGLPKQLSRCTILANSIKGWTGIEGAEFTHNCDTEVGSSGAGIFDASGKLVGLHHNGFDRIDGICDEKNKAIRIDAILEYLGNKSDKTRALKKELTIQ